MRFVCGGEGQFSAKFTSTCLLVPLLKSEAFFWSGFGVERGFSFYLILTSDYKMIRGVNFLAEDLGDLKIFGSFKPESITQSCSSVSSYDF